MRFETTKLGVLALPPSGWRTILKWTEWACGIKPVNFGAEQIGNRKEGERGLWWSVRGL